MLARAQSLRSLALSRVSGLSRSISYHLKSRPIDPYTYTSDDESMPTTFEVKSERVVHQRYLTVFDRVVKFTGENAGQVGGELSWYCYCYQLSTTTPFPLLLGSGKGADV